MKITIQVMFKVSKPFTPNWNKFNSDMTKYAGYNVFHMTCDGCGELVDMEGMPDLGICRKCWDEEQHEN